MKGCTVYFRDEAIYVLCQSETVFGTQSSQRSRKVRKGRGVLGAFGDGVG